MARLFPSLLGANPLKLEQLIHELDAHCAGFHIDVMDGHCVPNLAFGIATVNAIDSASKHPSWVHLMVRNPQQYIKELKLKARSIVSIQVECATDPALVAMQIKARGWIAGIALNPATPLSVISPHLTEFDHVLIMGVNPGHAGQPFIESTFEKLVQLSDYKKSHQGAFTIGIDGGITAQNIHACIQHGAQDIALASALFQSDNPVKALKALYASLEQP